MTSIRRFALSTIITACVLSASVYTSCTKDKTDKCKTLVCLHGGTCKDGACSCPTGYSGGTCADVAIYGTWHGHDNCNPSGSIDVIMTLTKSTTNANEVLINNPNNFGTSNTIVGTLSPDKQQVNYVDQVVNASINPDTLTGTIYLSDNSNLGHNFSGRSGSFTFSCSGNYTR